MNSHSESLIARFGGFFYARRLSKQMTSDVEFRIDGLDGALDRLRELPRNLQRRGLRSAVRRGAAVIRDAARKNARGMDDPTTKENIARNITVQLDARASRREGGAVFKVGVRGGAKSRSTNEANPGGDTFYWRFLEFGTSRQAAQPFLRPAMEESQGQVTSTIVTELNKEIDKLAERMR